MKTYCGVRAATGAVWITVEEGGQCRPLEPLTRRRFGGFEYGYDGAGPAELARTILGDVLGRPPRWWLYRAFLSQFIEPLDRAEPWTISEAEISAWLTIVEAQRQ